MRLSRQGFSGLLYALVAFLMFSGSLDRPAVAQDEAESGSGERAFMGFMRDYHPGQEFLEVLRLYPGGPAEKAGLRVGDRIVAFNSVRFHFSSVEEARHAFDWVRIGEPVELTVERQEGKTETLTLLPTRMPQAVARQRDEMLGISELKEGLEETLGRLAREGRFLVIEMLDDGSTTLTEEGSSEPLDSLDEYLRRQHAGYRDRIAAMQPQDRVRFKIARMGSDWILGFEVRKSHSGGS